MIGSATGDSLAGLVALTLTLALAACQGDARQEVDPTAATTPAVITPPASRTTHAGADAGLLYGRVTMHDGEIYEGRLRFGGDEEALWSNTFNGARDDIDRPFMARFGDIARLDARGRDLRVTLRSGTVVELNRYGADDFADGVRVWDARRGVVDLGEWGIRTIEFLAGPPSGAAAGPAPAPGPAPLYGTVHTPRGDFTGLVQWDREAALGSDVLSGRLRFDDIRSIARHSRESALVTLVDGRELVLSGTRDVGDGHRGIYVDDPRYGRVLVPWSTFERIDFRPGGVAPAYDEFPPGRPLTGTVVTRSGQRLAGRLVYDLDETETIETLDAPAQGVDYMIPFRRIASIVVPAPGAAGDPLAAVTLRGGEVLRLERRGDLGVWNAGVLVYVDGRARPVHVPWSDVARVEFRDLTS